MSPEYSKPNYSTLERAKTAENEQPTNSRYSTKSVNSTFNNELASSWKVILPGPNLPVHWRWRNRDKKSDPISAFDLVPWMIYYSGTEATTAIMSALRSRTWFHDTTSPGCNFDNLQRCLFLSQSNLNWTSIKSCFEDWFTTSQAVSSQWRYRIEELPYRDRRYLRMKISPRNR